MLTLIKKLFDLSIYAISRALDLIIPKSSKICVFASQGGARYFDNSKYLYEHILQHRQDISAVWIATNPRPEVPFIHPFSLKGLWFAYRAKHKFISYGIYDLGKLRFSRKSKIIQLWHGVPLKNIFYLENSRQGLLDKIKTYRELSNYNNFICCSDREAAHLARCTKLPSDKIVTLGYPRNDFLFSSILDPRVQKLKKAWTNIVLYAPTFRDGYSPFSLLSIHTLESLLDKLKERKCALVIRAHAKETIWRNDSTAFDIQEKLKIHTNLIYASNQEYPDVQDLMKASNLLISDYSGIIVDYLLLNRPIIRYCPDIDRYGSERGLTSDYEQINIGTMVKNEAELTSETISLLESEATPKYDTTAFHKWQDAHSCERILSYFNI